jgi:hypothetical protein
MLRWAKLLRAALAAGGADAAAIPVTFGHGARHLGGTGLSEAAVDAAVIAEVQLVGRTAGWYSGRVVVQGTTIVFRGYPLANGTTNVGTYYPLFPIP